MQPRTTPLVLEASEDSNEDTTSTASDKSPIGQEAEDTSEETQADSPPKKKQKKRIPRIAGRKARYLPVEQDLHNFSFVGDDEVRFYHSTTIALISDRGPVSPSPLNSTSCTW